MFLCSLQNKAGWFNHNFQEIVSLLPDWSIYDYHIGYMCLLMALQLNRFFPPSPASNDPIIPLLQCNFDLENELRWGRFLYGLVHSLWFHTYDTYCTLRYLCPSYHSQYFGPKLVKHLRSMPLTFWDHRNKYIFGATPLALK